MGADRKMLLCSMRFAMKFPIVIVVSALLATAAAAQDIHDHAAARHSVGSPQSRLRESGQSAFAAIAEATRALSGDPRTNWSKVNLDALREHLVDMDNVTMRSDVATTALQGGARFEITSRDPRVSASIVRMAHMHAAMARRESAYAIAVRDIPNGVMMTVTGASPKDADRIRGLGFFGLLSEGNHHQLHHFALAKGEKMEH
jgi:hypothetical protein